METFWNGHDLRKTSPEVFRIGGLICREMYEIKILTG